MVGRDIRSSDGSCTAVRVLATFSGWCQAPKDPKVLAFYLHIHPEQLSPSSIPTLENASWTKVVQHCVSQHKGSGPSSAVRCFDSKACFLSDILTPLYIQGAFSGHRSASRIYATTCQQRPKPPLGRHNCEGRGSVGHDA